MLEGKQYRDRTEWLAARKSYIGGSDAACIIGMNPWRTNVQLWEEKTGRRQPEEVDNPFVRYGAAAEGPLRDLFKLDYPQYRVSHEENYIFVNDMYPFAHASLDGLLVDEDGRLGVLEIKTTKINGAAQSEKWRERIPDNYFCQVLHYMAVMEADFAVLKAQLKYQTSTVTKHYFIERSDYEDDIQYLMAKEKEFSEYIKKGIEPPLVLPSV